MSAEVTHIPGLRIPQPVGAGLTHRGIVRDRNEDAILTDPAGELWAVADGMGGYEYGDVASDIVIDALATMPDGVGELVSIAHRLHEANARVATQARESGQGAMGATVVVMLIRRAIAHLVWAGDSRGYLMRGGHLRLLTHDHTVVQDLVDRGALRAEEAENHPESHVVTRAVGMGPDFEVESVSVPLIAGDRLMLCSDGLPRCVAQQQISVLMRGTATAEATCKALVSTALEFGAPDNVSVIIVDIVDG